MEVLISHDKWGSCLSKKTVILVHQLQVNESSLLYECLESDIFNAQQVSHVKAGEDEYKRAERCCDVLRRIDRSRYLTFIKILHKHQPSLAVDFAKCLGVSEEIIKSDDDAAPKEAGASAPAEVSDKSNKVDKSQKSTGSSIHVDLKKPDDQLLLKMLKNPRKYYKMSSKPRGKAIILNNETFDPASKLRKRDGSWFDATKLYDLFHKLQFDTEIWSNLTAKEIIDKIDEERTSGGHAKADAFVFIAMSHGRQGAICGTDGRKVCIEQEMIDPFDAENCPLLAGKPKLFFIQACRGRQRTTGSTKSDSAEGDDSGDDTDSTEMDGFPTTRNRIHEKADVLAFYATVPGFVSFRNSKLGSWFVQDLIDNINQYAHLHDIYHISTMVNNQLTQRQSDKDGYKQTSKLESTLSKTLYLFPNFEEDSD